MRSTARRRDDPVVQTEPDLPAGRLIDYVAEQWGLAVTGVRFLPVGDALSAHYRVEADKARRARGAVAGRAPGRLPSGNRPGPSTMAGDAGRAVVLSGTPDVSGRLVPAGGVMVESSTVPLRQLAPLLAAGVVWLTLAALAAEAGLVVRPAGEPPLRIGLAVGLPVLGVGLALLFVRRVRGWAQSLDLALLCNLQGWRVAGLAFLVLYSQGLLTGAFAWPAGLGDLAVGIAAPFVAGYVARRGRATGRVVAGWTAFGIADFVVAVALGTANSLTVRPVLAGGGTAHAPTAELPLSLIPTVVVPFLLIVHLLTLARLRAQPSPSRHAHPGAIRPAA